ncbi:MAG: 50S ribosomal protein L29 [Acidobacteriota bacterium]|nr:50S ribosomal protein L29 [Acidobacteriota bacterium]
MKKKEVMDQLREMDLEELRDQADSLKESLFRLKFKKSLGVGESVNDIRRERKTLARVQTLITQKNPKQKGRKAERVK